MCVALLALPLVPTYLSAQNSDAAASAITTRAPDSRAPAFVGAIRGRVVEKDGGQGIPSAQVAVVGTRLGNITDANGNYIIRGVGAGQVAVRAVRIGFVPIVQTVTVTDGGEAVANFSLERAVAHLDEVITTATGQQSRREFGNAVATVKADSIAQIAPVTTVNEMLQGRTSGVQVIQGAGQTGVSSSIRIRGNSSLSLTNEPLIIVDGVRYDNSPISGNFSTQRINRFSDFNPEDIESIDIIKGPSAAALYGTAAANGIIVIKTKQGEQGKARWTAFGEEGQVSQPAKFDYNWRSWGHNLNAAGVPVGGVTQCKISSFSLKLCTIDSLTKNNPFTNPLTAPFAKSTPRSSYGAQVSGGSDVLRYFLSGTHEGETGPYTMPSTEITRITTDRGTRPTGTQIHPNQLQQNSLRGNFQVALAPNATVNVSAGYIDRMLLTPFDGGFFAGVTFQMMTAPGFVTSTNGLQREFIGDIFSIEQKHTEQRFTGSTALNWAPIDWLQVRSTLGVDQANTYNDRLQLLGQGTKATAAWGPGASQGFSGIDNDRSNNLRYSVDAGATATKALTSQLQSKTTVGAQWFKDELYQTQGEGYGFGPGVSTPNSAAQRLAWEFTTENATYGGFIEEQLSHRDRLFATVGVRSDQNSAFGRNVGNTIYPRASLSYVISDESWFPHFAKMDKLRLRAAVGKAGVQPGTLAALQFLTALTYPLGGAETPALRLNQIGNAALKPEVTTEYEAGADLGFFRERFNIEATIFNKQSKDALFNRPLPPSYGAGANQFVNLARVQNRGYELTLDAQLVRTQPVSWDVRVNGSHVSNKLVDAGGAPLATTAGQRNVVGYPLFGLWDRKILGYKDLNGDGIITENEVTVATDTSYRGSTLPEYEAGFTNNFGFFGDALRVMTLFDYRGKFYNQWGYQNQRCVSTGNCRAVNDPKAPLADQAATVMAASSLNRTIWGYFVPNDFIRFRELSVSYTLPQRLSTRFLRNHSTNLVLSGRNLGLVWTKYPGIDPESNSSVANTGGGNNDFFSPPILRYWIARLNVAF